MSVMSQQPEVVQETIIKGSIEELQQILASQNKPIIDRDEVEELGASLVEFYQLLSIENDDDSI